MNKNSETVLSCLGLMAILIGTTIIGTAGNGWALSILWTWFIVPIFDWPALSIVQAIGVGMVITFLTRHSINTDGSKKTTEAAIGGLLSNAILYPVLVIALGYIVTLFL